MLSRPERLALVQQLCDQLLTESGILIPVTPVPLACAAIQNLGADFIPHDQLIERMRELREVLVELNARVLRHDRDIEETFDRAGACSACGACCLRVGGGYAVLPANRSLIAYYASSIAHLLGPFEEGVRRRDAWVVEEGTGMGGAFSWWQQ